MMRATAPIPPKDKVKGKKGTKRVITPNATPPPKDKTQKKTEVAAEELHEPTNKTNKVARSLDIDSLSETLSDNTDAAKHLLNAGHGARTHTGRGQGGEQGSNSPGDDHDGGNDQEDQSMPDKGGKEEKQRDESEDDDDDDDSDDDDGPDPFGAAGDADVIVYNTVRLLVPKEFFDNIRANETLTSERMSFILSEFIQFKALQYKKSAEDV